jgi:hypothetical protein
MLLYGAHAQAFCEDPVANAVYDCGPSNTAPTVKMCVRRFARI